MPWRGGRRRSSCSSSRRPSEENHKPRFHSRFMTLFDVPTVLKIRNVLVSIYSNDHPPPHVRAMISDGALAKLELNCPDGPVRLVEQAGFRMVEVNEIGAAIAAQLVEICSKWKQFMAEFEALTQQEFTAITRMTSKKMSRRLLAVEASYDQGDGRLMITPNSGAVVGIPSSAVPGLERAAPSDLQHIEIEVRRTRPCWWSRRAHRTSMAFRLVGRNGGTHPNRRFSLPAASSSMSSGLAKQKRTKRRSGSVA